MPIIVTSEVLQSYTDRFFDAVELVPEDQHDFVLWKGTFKNAEGQDVEKQCQTPAEMAADVVIALEGMMKFTKGEVQMSPEIFEGIKARMAELSAKSMKEIAAEGRAVATRIVPQVDDLTEELQQKEIVGPRGPMTTRAMATLILTHVAHHRGQLYQILRAIGVTPPGFL